jgi:hypothetical protein
MKVDLSRFRAAPSARLSHLPFESDGTFIHCCSTSRRSCGTHSDPIQASTQWYLQSDAFSLANRKLSCAVSIGVDPVYGRPCVARYHDPALPCVLQPVAHSVSSGLSQQILQDNIVEHGIGQQTFQL